MDWQNEINMENLSVAVGSYGGPIALIRDRKKFVKVQGIGKPIISIYSVLSQILYEKVTNLDAQ